MPIIGGIDLTGGMIAFGALLVYDVFFVTYDQEVALVWPSRWTFGKLLFFLNRYLPFFDTFLSLHREPHTKHRSELRINLKAHLNYSFDRKNTDRECLFGFRAVTWLIVVGIIIAEIILMIRTYALWGQNRAILVIILIVGFSVFIPAIVVTQIEVDSFAYEALPLGCSKTQDSSPIIFVAFLLLIICETSIVILTVIRARQHHLSRETRSPLIKQMYKDGLIYYVYLLAFSIVNLLIAVAAPPEFSNWLTTPQRVVHSLLCTRVLLHIRAHSLNPDSEVLTTQTSLSFAAQDEQGRLAVSSSGSGTASGSGSGSGSNSGSRAILSFTNHTHSHTQDQCSVIEYKDVEMEREIADRKCEGGAIELYPLSRRAPRVKFDELDEETGLQIRAQTLEKGKKRG